MRMRRWSSLRVAMSHMAGALLLLAGVGLAAMTARGLLHYRAIAGQHGGQMLDLGADGSLQADRHGYMVRLVGTPTVVEAPRDLAFNVQANTPLLTRHVEMFQWREVRIGAGVHYEQDWVDRWLDASQFREPARHANPARMPIPSEQFAAGRVQLGGFTLSPPLLRALPGSAPMPPQPQSLPSNLAASFSPYQGYLVTSAHPGAPRLGDLRVSWSGVPLRQMTIVARVDGDQLVPAVDAADGKGYDVEVGDVSLFNMFPDLPQPPEFVASSNLLAVLLAALGAFLLLPVRRAGQDATQPEASRAAFFVRAAWSGDVYGRDALLALGLGALTVGVVTGVLWLGNDTRALLGWWLVAACSLLFTVWRLRRAD
jgi:hypothetical protein